MGGVCTGEPMSAYFHRNPLEGAFELYLERQVRLRFARKQHEQSILPVKKQFLHESEFSGDKRCPSCGTIPTALHAGDVVHVAHQFGVPSKDLQRAVDTARAIVGKDDIT